MVCGNDKCLGLFLIDALPVAEVADIDYANLEKLNPEPEVADVETPKSATKFTKNLDEPEESPKPNSNNDRSSNSTSNNNTDNMEFNEEKIKNKVTHMSAHDAREMETDRSEALKEREEPQQAPHQKFWSKN